MANTKRQSGAHPYVKWEGTPLWEAIEKGIADLSENRDISEITGRNYIVGYLCNAVGRRKQRVVGQLLQDRKS
jgi:hypothetical protein